MEKRPWWPWGRDKPNSESKAEEKDWEPPKDAAPDRWWGRHIEATNGYVLILEAVLIGVILLAVFPVILDALDSVTSGLP